MGSKDFVVNLDTGFGGGNPLPQTKRSLLMLLLMEEFRLTT